MPVKRANAFIPDQHNIHRSVGGSMDAGAAFTNTTPITEDISISGAGMVRVWGKFSHGGSLTIEYLNWGANGVYDTNACDDIAVTANVEISQILQLMGERGLRLTFTPTASGTVTYLDVAACVGMVALA